MFTCLSISQNESYSNTSDNHTFDEDLHELKLVAYGFVGTGVVTFGVIGNVLNLIVLTRPTLQETTYTYLSCLAVSDLLTLLLGVTSLLRLQDAQPTTWPSAFYFAHVELPLINALMASSIFLVVCLTVDRFISVCYPAKFKDIHNRDCTKRAIISAYCIAFTVYVPVCLEKVPVQFGLEDYLACENSDVVNSVFYQMYLMAKEFIVRLGPVLILIFLNGSIVYSFGRRRRRFSRRYPSASSFRKKIKEERRLVVLLMAIVVSFFICVTPASVLTLLHSEDKDLHYGFQVFRAVANVLELANYAMNFYLYCFFSSEIRLTLLELLGRIMPSIL